MKPFCKGSRKFNGKSLTLQLIAPLRHGQRDDEFLWFVCHTSCCLDSKLFSSPKLSRMIVCYEVSDRRERKRNTTFYYLLPVLPIRVELMPLASIVGETTYEMIRITRIRDATHLYRGVTYLTTFMSTFKKDKSNNSNSR